MKSGKGLHHWRKVSQTGVKTIISRDRKEIFKDIFDVKVVQLMEAYVWGRKYGIGPVGGYGAMGSRVLSVNFNI